MNMPGMLVHNISDCLQIATNIEKEKHFISSHIISKKFRANKH